MGDPPPVDDDKIDDDKIIDAIYDAVFDPARWNVVAKAFADQVGGSSCFILQADQGNFTVEVLSGYGLEVLGIPEYEAHFHRLDIWKQGLLRDRGERVVPFHHLVPQPTFHHSEIFNDWVKPGLGYEVWWGLGGRFSLSGDRVGIIGVHRPRRRGEMGGQELQAIRRFIPHLSRALRLNHSFQVKDARIGALEHLCDAVPNPTMLVDERGQLDYANSPALAILQRRDGLTLDGEGTLRAASRVEDQALRVRIAASCDPKQAGSRADGGNPLRITRSQTGPLLVTVAPVPVERFALTARLAFISVDDIWEAREIDSRKIAAALGVTPAEAKLVAALSRGASLRQAAAMLGIRYNTARTQLRNVLEKSGINRQSELMLRIARLR